MKLAVFKELNDQRVSIIPASIPKLLALGVEVLVEKDAGKEAFYEDQEYTNAGAKVVDRSTLQSEADVAISIHPFKEDELSQLKSSCLLISEFQPFNQPEVSQKLKEKNFQALSLDMIPRTTLAQSMDVLSSMASISGYKAVLEAARLLPRYFPMMITAAGSIRPAKVLVLGAGVAGLQAIATARRLGAMVEAFLWT